MATKNTTTNNNGTKGAPAWDDDHWSDPAGDLFDAGTLSGPTSVDDIARASGASRKSVGRTRQHMAVPPYAVNESIPARWSSPRSWPHLPKETPTAKAVRALYASGEWSGPCYARDLAPRVGVAEETVVHAFRQLRFKVVKRAYKKFVRMEPAVWAPPIQWPSGGPTAAKATQSGP